MFRLQPVPGSESPIRIAVIANMIDPHRSPIFERVAQRDDAELFVLYETEAEPNRDWGRLAPGYEHEVLRSTTIDLRRLGTDAYLHFPRGALASLKRFDPDVVIGFGGGIWSSPTNIAALLTRRRHGWAFAPWWGSFPRTEPTLARRVLDRWVRWFVSAGDAWIAYGSRAASEVVRLGADPTGVVIVPNVARPPAQMDALDIERPGGMRFLFVGQLIDRKGVRDLLDAFSGSTVGELWIAGDGPLRPDVERAARESGKIRVLGHLGWRELQGAYLSVDALVLPSRYEVWGLVVNEALEHGLVVLVSDQVGAADDLVAPGVNGLIVPAGSSIALRDAVEEIAMWPFERWASARAESSSRLAMWSRERAADALVRASRIAVARRMHTDSGPQGPRPHA